jgi:hypothetical protein
LSPGQQRLTRAVAGVAALYAALSLAWQLLMLALELDVDLPLWHADSPVEICLALIVLGGTVFAATQLYRNRRDAALRLGWAFATAGMALIATSETADWFNEAAPFWNEQVWFEAPLWLVAALCIHQCTRLYAAQPRVRSWFRAGFALQLASTALDITQARVGSSSSFLDGLLDMAVDYTGLLCVLCYTSSLVLTRLDRGMAARRRGRWPLDVPAPTWAAGGVQAPRAAAPIEIGALARTLFFERHMFRAARYPTRYALLHRPVARQLVSVAMAVLFGGRIGPSVERSGGVPLVRQIADLLKMGVVQGIDAVSYYLYELYRPAGRRDAPYYLTRYETKNGLFTVLNAQRPRCADVPHDLTDKRAFGAACAQAGIPTPPILLTAIDGRIESHASVAAFDRDLFAKLMRGRGTMKTGQFRRVCPLIYVDRRGRPLALADIVEALRRQSLTVVGTKTTPVILQPRLRNHPGLADLAHDSLIVVRVVTCLNRADVPEVTHAMLRILTKIEPDWDTRPDREYGAAIDPQTGRLGPLTGDKPDSCLTWHESHPVTGARILGRVVEDWPALKDLALRAHAVFRNRIVIGWDLALTTEGPMVIEGNSNMDVSFIQRAYRDPIGHSRLGELLAYHLTRL